MAYYLGFDAGGTRTDGALANDTTILARASGGSVKLLRVSPEDAEKNLRFVVETLFSKTGILPAQIDSVCIGIAGYTVPLVTDWVERTLATILGGAPKLLVAGDVEIALGRGLPRWPRCAHHRRDGLELSRPHHQWSPDQRWGMGSRAR